MKARINNRINNIEFEFAGLYFRQHPELPGTLIIPGHAYDSEWCPARTLKALVCSDFDTLLALSDVQRRIASVKSDVRRAIYANRESQARAIASALPRLEREKEVLEEALGDSLEKAPASPGRATIHFERMTNYGPVYYLA